MRRLLPVLLALSCASEDPGETTPTECNRNARRGTYLVQYELQSGNCGPIPDELVLLPDNDAPDGCEVTSEIWRENNCRQDLRVECDDGTELTGYTTARDERADRITGKISVNGTGCRGTYGVTFTRE